MASSKRPPAPRRMRRAVLLCAVLAAALVTAACGGDDAPDIDDVKLGAQADGEPESTSLKVGISVADSAYLPLYACIQGPCKDAGLDIELLTFEGDAEASQALLGGATDLNVQSLAGILTLVGNDSGVRAFYGGMNSADFAWVAQPDIKSWDDLEGKEIGVSTFGSLTDTLTRTVLKEHGLDPETDVKIVQAGGSPTAWPTIQQGALDAGILSVNFWLQAEEEGFTILGHQRDEIAPAWPKEVFAATQDWIASNPNTITTLLRAFSDSVEMVQSDKDLATQIFVDELDYDPERAGRVYDTVKGDFYADGQLPDDATMDAFWDAMVASKTVDRALKPDEYLISDWIDSYEQWSSE